MNKSDCDKIAYILAKTGAPDEVCSRFFELDERIKKDWDGYKSIIKLDNAVDERFESLMIEQFGDDWMLARACTNKDTARVMDQARQEIYGDNYHPSLFKR